MRILIAPSTSWQVAPGAVAAGIASAWREVAPADTIDELILHDGGSGFGSSLAAAAGGTVLPDSAEALYLDGASALADQDAGGGEERTTASSYRLGVLLAQVWEQPARRVVLGLPADQTSVAWADGGAGLLAGLAETFGLADSAPTEHTPDPSGSAPHPGGEQPEQALASSRLIGGGGALRGITAEQIPDLHALRARLGTKQLVVATRSTAPLLGLGGLAAELDEAGTLDAPAAHDLERALGDFSHAIAGALGTSLVGQNLLTGHGDGREVSARARQLVSAPGAAAGGGVGFILGVLGGQLSAGLEVSAEWRRLDERLAQADVVLIPSPVLDAVEMHDGVTPLVAARALERGIPVVVMTGDTHAGRREWAAIGVSALFQPAQTGGTHDDVLAGLIARTPGIARTWSR